MAAQTGLLHLASVIALGHSVGSQPFPCQGTGNPGSRQTPRLIPQPHTEGNENSPSPLQTCAAAGPGWEGEEQKADC